MAHNCNHNHSADRWTKVSGLGEAVSSFVSDGYWLATLFDIATGFTGTLLPISWWGLGVGIFGASLTAAGSTYSHWVLNTSHQDCEEESKPEESPLLTNTSSSGDLTAHLHPSLTIPQKLALFGDYISHTGDIAGPITFVADLATKNTLPRWQQAVVHGGATLFGAICSIADVRTCKRNMEKANEHNHHHAPVMSV